jgi:hypothetical protein
MITWLMRTLVGFAKHTNPKSIIANVSISFPSYKLKKEYKNDKPYYKFTLISIDFNLYRNINYIFYLTKDLQDLGNLNKMINN